MTAFFCVKSPAGNRRQAGVADRGCGRRSCAENGLFRAPDLIRALLCRVVRLEPVTFEDGQRFRRADEIEPDSRSFAMLSPCDLRSGIDRRRVLSDRDVDVLDRVADLLRKIASIAR